MGRADGILLLSVTLLGLISGGRKCNIVIYTIIGVPYLYLKCSLMYPKALF